MKTDVQILEEMNLPKDIFRVYRKNVKYIEKNKYTTRHSIWKIKKTINNIIYIKRIGNNKKEEL